MHSDALVDAITVRIASLAAPLAVAYSGGRDSTALLHATLAAAQGSGREVHAFHVHHGLSRHADAWLEHVERQCLAWKAEGHHIHFGFVRLHGSPAQGESVEAWARAGRYKALGTMAAQHKIGALLLGHHQRDQAETFLLQALRGAGPRGLASMPAVADRDGVMWLRPWLHQTREVIDAYVATHALKFVEDDSNGDDRFARNRLRLDVWPALQRAFPDAEGAITHAARWAQDAGDALAELAAIDLAHVAMSAPVDRIHGTRPVTPVDRIDLARFGSLSLARRTNALRLFMRELEGESPSLALLERLRTELAGAAPASWQARKGWLRRYRGELTYHEARVDEPLSAPAGKAVGDVSLAITGAGVWPVPAWHGELLVELVSSHEPAGAGAGAGAGADAAAEPAAPAGHQGEEGRAMGGVPMSLLGSLRLAPRRGGESFQVAAGRPARSLKKQYQAAGVPAWQRSGPLVYAGEQLIHVPGLGIDARALASTTSEPQATLRWRAVRSLPGAG